LKFFFFEPPSPALVYKYGEIFLKSGMVSYHCFGDGVSFSLPPLFFLTPKSQTSFPLYLDPFPDLHAPATAGSPLLLKGASLGEISSLFLFYLSSIN